MHMNSLRLLTSRRATCFTSSSVYHGMGKMVSKISAFLILSGVLILRIAVLYALVGVCSAEPYQIDQDSDQYRLAKAQLDALERESMSPRYGTCWLNAIEMLKSSCKQLTEDKQHQLAFRFANCFLAKIGRPTYECNGEDSNVELCVSNMNSEAVGIYTHFFTEAKSYCFVLQSQAWQERTHLTIKSLSDSSALVAEQMEDSSELQALILKRQNDSVRYQEIALLQSAELRKAIEESKEIAYQQNSVMTDIFDRVKVLQSLLIGEFTGIYSVAFYGGCMVVSYIFTTTPRTSGARFWLFLVIVLSIMFEQVIVKFGGDILESTEEIDVYNDILRIRKVFLVFYLAIYFWNAYHYKDYEKINNQLLVRLEQENRSNQLVLGRISHLCSELASRQKSVTKSRKSEHLSAESEVTGISGTTFSSNLSAASPTTRIKKCPPVTSIRPSEVQNLHASGSSTGYDTQSSSVKDSFCTSSVLSVADRTFVPKDIGGVHDSSLGTLTSERTQSLLDELRGLRHSTPFDEIGCCPELSFNGVCDEKPKQEQTSLSSSVNSRRSGFATSSPCPYNLRSRARKSSLADSSTINSESPESFSRQVKQVTKSPARIQDRLMATVKPQQQNNEASSSPNITPNSKRTSRRKVIF